jgi:hypothetical protein
MCTPIYHAAAQGIAHIQNRLPPKEEMRSLVVRTIEAAIPVVVAMVVYTVFEETFSSVPRPCVCTPAINEGRFIEASR